MSHANFVVYLRAISTEKSFLFFLIFVGQAESVRMKIVTQMNGGTASSSNFRSIESID